MNDVTVYFELPNSAATHWNERRWGGGEEGGKEEKERAKSKRKERKKKRQKQKWSGEMTYIQICIYAQAYKKKIDAQCTPTGPHTLYMHLSLCKHSLYSYTNVHEHERIR